MKLHFIRSSKERSCVLEDLYSYLVERGFEVTEGIPDRTAHDLDLTPRHDLYILKARTELPVSIAGVLHQRGARILNPYPSCVMILNKIVATAMMRHAGIPAPRSWATADPSLLHFVAAAERKPLVIKPFNGIHSQNVMVANSSDELEDWPVTVGPMLVQEFIEGCAQRFKVHCVGEQVFATCKPFSLGGHHEPGRPLEVSDAVRDIAVRCGKLFGLGLYGLDVLIAAGGPVVVDVNPFPGYKGVPGIAKVIGDYIAAYARGRVSLMPGEYPRAED
ncbi:MAG: hypothetical protein DMD82_12545 [Candidatus Rokuibacteriota bacterium]|nr:MAG: hypothetical protein DMD82_12545 [Candidatus Rokubacteria bacterium]